MIDRSVQCGREFVKGSAADLMVWISVSNTLSRAIYSWRSTNLTIVKTPKEQVLMFLAEVSPEHLKSLDWAMKACGIVLLKFDERVAEMQATQASEPSLVPAAAAGSADVAPTTTGGQLRKDGRPKSLALPWQGSSLVKSR